jgi:hypothetical protein
MVQAESPRVFAVRFRFRAVLAELDMRQSAGRTGSRFDNAAESLFAVLKAEIGTTVRATRAKARTRSRQRLDLAAQNGSAGPQGVTSFRSWPGPVDTRG